MEQIKKNIRLGIVVSDRYPRVLMCIDNTLRTADKELCPNVNIGDYVILEEGENDEAVYIIPISEFEYIKTPPGIDDCTNYNGINVPNTLLNKEKIIIDKGSSYQFVVYYKRGNYFFADMLRWVGESNIIRSYFNKLIYPTKDDLWNGIKKIEDYLLNLDVDKIIDSFTIENEEVFISRPGKDDYYFVEKVDSDIDEPYIQTLFPRRREEIYENSGYCAAHTMSIHPAKREYYEEETELILNAKNKYCTEKHRKFLICNYIHGILYEQNSVYKDNLYNFERYRNSFIKLLNDKDCPEIFVAKYNTLLRENKNYRYQS